MCRRIRPLEEQFKASTVRRIRRIQKRVDNLALVAPGMRLFFAELSDCLESGLLLSALMLTGVVLENSTRELLVKYTAKAAALKSVSFSREEHEADLEQFYEENKSPRWDFSKMIDLLVALGLLAARRADEFKQFYRKSRNPLHHGLVRRLSGGGDFLFGRLLRHTEVEELIEQRGIAMINNGLSLVESLDRIALRARVIVVK